MRRKKFVEQQKNQEAQGDRESEDYHYHGEMQIDLLNAFRIKNFRVNFLNFL
jgi:hypothetical protein